MTQAIPGGSSSDVFVSYASQDAAVATSVVAHVEGQRNRCWMAPRDVQPGTVYADAIVRAINEAKAMVLVLSASAMDSAHVGDKRPLGQGMREPDAQEAVGFGVARSKRFQRLRPL
jgi:hypothetical protein